MKWVFFVTTQNGLVPSWSANCFPRSVETTRSSSRSHLFPTKTTWALSQEYVLIWVHLQVKHLYCHFIIFTSSKTKSLMKSASHHPWNIHVPTSVYVLHTPEIWYIKQKRFMEQVKLTQAWRHFCFNVHYRSGVFFILSTSQPWTNAFCLPCTTLSITKYLSTDYYVSFHAIHYCLLYSVHLYGHKDWLD